MATIQGLKSFLTAPESECKFSELNTAIQSPNIRLKITFWGKRVITVQGEEGSVSLHVLAARVISIIRARLSKNDWPSNDAPDKSWAKRVVDRLDQYYSRTDTLIAQEKNYFTWILAKIRDLRWARVQTRWDIEYLQSWDFNVGYKFPHASWLWGHDPVPEWAVKRYPENS